jgi:hypothetical protein
MIGLRQRAVVVIFDLKILIRSAVVVFVKSMTISFGTMGYRSAHQFVQRERGGQDTFLASDILVELVVFKER